MVEGNFEVTTTSASKGRRAGGVTFDISGLTHVPFIELSAAGVASANIFTGKAGLTVESSHRWTFTSANVGRGAVSAQVCGGTCNLTFIVFVSGNVTRVTNVTSARASNARFAISGRREIRVVALASETCTTVASERHDQRYTSVETVCVVAARVPNTRVLAGSAGLLRFGGNVTESITPTKKAGRAVSARLTFNVANLALVCFVFAGKAWILFARIGTFHARFPGVHSQPREGSALANKISRAIACTISGTADYVAHIGWILFGSARITTSARIFTTYAALFSCLDAYNRREWTRATVRRWALATVVSGTIFHHALVLVSRSCITRVAVTRTVTGCAGLFVGSK